MKQESQRCVRSALPPARSLLVFGGGAEAGRADHGAVAASQATRGDLVPAGMVEIVEEEVADAVVSSVRPMCGGCARDGRIRGGDILGRGGSPGKGGEHGPAILAADLDQILRPVASPDLGQRQVEARPWRAARYPSRRRSRCRRLVRN